MLNGFSPLTGLSPFEPIGLGDGGAPANNPPVANAGADQEVDSGALVVLNGSGSDADPGASLTYLWAQTAGETVTLSDDEIADPEFTAPTLVFSDDPEVLTFTLTVSDGIDSDDGSVSVTVNPPPDYLGDMAALLSGTTGFALIPNDISNLFIDTDGLPPVTAIGQQVNRFDSDFGTTAYSFWNTSVTGPLWTGDGLECNGTNGMLNRTSYTFLSSMSQLTVTARAMLTAVAATRYIFAFATSTSATPRLTLRVLSTGAVVLDARRANGDTLLTLTSAAGLIVANTPFTLQVLIDYLTTGSVEVLLDGVLIASGTLNGSPGVSDATATARIRFCSNLVNTPGDVLLGDFGGFVFDRHLADSTELALHRGFVEAVSF